MYQNIEEQHHFEAQEAREREEREAQEQKRAEAERADRERDERARAERERDERDARDRAERELADKDRAERDAKDRERRKEREEERKERQDERAPEQPKDEQRADHEQDQKVEQQPERYPSRPQNVETNLRRGLLDGRIAAAVASRGDVTPTVTMEREAERKLEPSKASWTKDYEVKQDEKSGHVSYSRDGEEKIRDTGKQIQTASDEKSIKDGVALALERSKESDRKFSIDAQDPSKRAAIWKEVVKQNGQDRVNIRENEWNEFGAAVKAVEKEKYLEQKAAREATQQHEQEEEHGHGK